MNNRELISSVLRKFAFTFKQTFRIPEFIIRTTKTNTEEGTVYGDIHLFKMKVADWETDGDSVEFEWDDRSLIRFIEQRAKKNILNMVERIVRPR